jgi:hypothetical protein
MDNGDLLLLAVADVTVDGQRLEGVAVRPSKWRTQTALALLIMRRDTP